MIPPLDLDDVWMGSVVSAGSHLPVTEFRYVLAAEMLRFSSMASTAVR
jgi:hypothetical protein